MGKAKQVIPLMWRVHRGVFHIEMGAVIAWLMAVFSGGFIPEQVRDDAFYLAMVCLVVRCLIAVSRHDENPYAN